MREYMIRRSDGSEFTFLVSEDDTPPASAVPVDRAVRNKARHPKNKGKVTRGR